MLRMLLAVAMAFIAGQAKAADVAVDVPALTGQSKQTVQKILGKPESCSKGERGEKCHYHNEHAVVFINGVADWFTVFANAPYSDDAITAVGFQAEKPDFANKHVKTWRRGMRTAIQVPERAKPFLRPGEAFAEVVQEISVFPSGTDRVFYIHVRTLTP